jgi:hypothetical protein
MILLYIDPGFGSLFVQGLVTVAVGITFYFNKVKAVLGLGSKNIEIQDELNEKIEIK